MFSKVIDRNDFAVGSLDGARVAHLPGRTVIAQHDLTAPGLATVMAEPGTNAVRAAAVAVGQCEASVFQVDQAWRIAAHAAGRGHWTAEELPDRAVVIGRIGVDPVFRTILACLLY